MTVEERAKRMREVYLGDDNAIPWEDCKGSLRERWIKVANGDLPPREIGYKLELTAEELTNSRRRWYDYRKREHNDAFLAFIQSRIVPIPAPDYFPDDVALNGRVPELEAEVERLTERLHVVTAKSKRRAAALRQSHRANERYIVNMARMRDRINAVEYTSRHNERELEKSRQEIARMTQPVSDPTDGHVEELAKVLAKTLYVSEWDKLGCPDRESGIKLARAAYAHIAAEGGIRANVTEAEILETMYCADGGSLPADGISEGSTYRIEAAAVMALLRERGVVDSALQDELAHAREQLSILHDDETVDGVVMERDSYRIRLERAEHDLTELRSRQSAPRPVKVRFDVTESDIRCAWGYAAEFPRSDWSQWIMPYLAAHAVIDLHPGVPSAEELKQIYTEAFNLTIDGPTASLAVYEGICAILAHLAPYLQPKQPDIDVPASSEVKVHGLTGDMVLTQNGKRMVVAPDIDPVTLERLAEIAHQSFTKYAAQPYAFATSAFKDDWRRVVCAILAAAKPVVDVKPGELHDAWRDNLDGYSAIIALCNSRIRYSVRVPSQEVEALAKVMGSEYRTKFNIHSHWDDWCDSGKEGFRAEATAALRHFGMEVEG